MTPDPSPPKPKSRRQNAPRRTALTTRLLRLLPLLTALGGFALGVAQIATPWVERDVRNKVYEATFQDKERALKTQADLLSLQETYSKKLSEVRQLEAQLDVAKKQTDAVRTEADERLKQATRQTLAVRGYYRELERREQERLQKERLSAEEQKKASEARAVADKRRNELLNEVRPWKGHSCEIETAAFREGTVFKSPEVCVNFGSVFAKGTPDEKITHAALTDQCDRDKPGKGDGWNRAIQACEKHLRAFFASKGWTNEKVDALFDLQGGSGGMAATLKILSQ